MFTNVEKCNLICGVSTKYLIIVKKNINYQARKCRRPEPRFNLKNFLNNYLHQHRFDFFFYFPAINKKKTTIINHFIVLTLQQEPNAQPRIKALKTLNKTNKNQVVGTFLSAFTVVQHVILSIQPDPVSNLQSVRKSRIGAAAHGRAARTLVVGVKPESRQADKMWNSWRGQEGKFQTNIRTCGGSGGVVTFSCSGPSKLNTFFFFDASCMNFKFSLIFLQFKLGSIQVIPMKINYIHIFFLILTPHGLLEEILSTWTSFSPNILMLNFNFKNKL